MSSKAVEGREASDYTLITPQRIGPRGVFPWFARFQQVYTGEPIQVKLGPSTLEIVGIEFKMVEVTLKEGPAVRWHIPGQPYTDIRTDMDGEITAEKPTLSRIRRFEAVFSVGEDKNRQVIILQGNPFRNAVVNAKA